MRTFILAVFLAAVVGCDGDTGSGYDNPGGLDLAALDVPVGHDNGNPPHDPGQVPQDPGTLPNDPGQHPTDPGTATDPGNPPYDPGTPTDEGVNPDPGTGPTGPDWIQERVYSSGTRIKAKVGRTADGASMFLNWYDTELEIDCWFQDDYKGKRRCLPTIASAYGYYFEDAHCEKPLINIARCSDQGRWVRFFTFDKDPVTGCSTIATVIYYEIGSPFTGASGYRADGNGGCVQQDFASVYDSYNLYRPGKEVSPSLFAEVTVNVE